MEVTQMAGLEEVHKDRKKRHPSENMLVKRDGAEGDENFQKVGAEG